MSQTMTLEEAQARLTEIVTQLNPGEELILTQNNQPVARLVVEKPGTGQPRQPGSARGKLIILAEDEEHLRDFQEYMP
jgi:antitoxin (DNA-binding transcriptional repressor) of toxin-antitoxin stability system